MMELTILYIIIALVYVPIIGLSIFLMVLYVKLALRGIKALDIYLAKAKENRI